MSDEDPFDEESSEEEEVFSGGSEDDWEPGKDDEDEESETETSPSPVKPLRPQHRKSPNPRGRKCDPESPKKPLPASVQRLLQAATVKKRETLNLSAKNKGSVDASPPKTKTRKRPPAAQDGTQSDSSSDSSSGDENLVNPSNLDLGSSFFKPIEKKERDSLIPTPTFDCNIGMGTLSGSESDCDEQEPSTAINVVQNLQDFHSKIEEAKESLKKYESAAKGADKPTETTDVTQLLALGEAKQEPEDLKTKKKPTKAKKRPAKKAGDSGEESDWEEVKGEAPEDKSQSSIIPQNVHVVLDFPGEQRRRNKVQDELELALKRQINKEKREQQVVLHQSVFRDWLEQGNNINSTVNEPTLFKEALKFLSSARSYPKDKAGLSYFQEITKWYAKDIKLDPAAEVYPPLIADLDMRGSLEKQIKSKAVQWKRDYVLIFVILLRAIGIQCRVVINLVLPPIRPPQSELCRISAKSRADSSVDEKNKSFSEEQKKAKAKKKAPAKRVKKEETDDDVNEDEDFDDIVEKLSSPKIRSKARAAKVEVKEEKSPSKSKHNSPPKPSTSAKEPSRSSRSSKREPSTRSTRAAKTEAIPQLDGLDDVISSPIGNRTRSRSKTPVNVPLVKRVLVSKQSVDSPIKAKKRSTRNTLTVPGTKSPESELELFSIDPTEKKTVPKKPKIKRKNETEIVIPSSSKSPRLAAVAKIDRRVLSPDTEPQDTAPKKVASNKMDFWCEVWSEEAEVWMPVDLFKATVDKPETLIRNATQPIAYVLAWNNNCSVRDVSLRYCPQWHSVNKKARTNEEFVVNALKPFAGTEGERERKENVQLQRLILDRPMPTSIADFKNHPLYALQRHLLKFEALYPPDAPSLGFVRGEPVYARECVHKLHSRELWVKQARVVKPKETPYKVVTARPKWDKASNTVIKDQPLELFGKWQTSEYEPPVAENGIVPKNAYGNVELFKECMLPINTVHLPYNGLNKVCKRLKVDYAPAVVGFDFHSGYSHPVYEGYVVCQEFSELVTNEWLKDQEEAERREKEKFQERIFGNWKRLIRGLLIKRRLQLKYNFGEDETQGAAAAAKVEAPVAGN